MVEGGLEPRFFRDALSQFVRGKGNYAERFRKKLSWVLENRRAVARALGVSLAEPRMAGVLLTLYPSFASYSIADFPCVSITEFMLDYEAAGGWPYSAGRRA